MSRQKSATPGGPMHGHGPGGRMMMGEKAKNFRGSTRKLLSYLKPFHWAIIMVLLCAAVSTVFTIVGPKVLAKATDELAKGIMAVVTGGDGVIDFGYIGMVLLTLLGLYLLSALFSYIQGFTMAGISAKVSYRLRQQIIQKINRLPLGYFHKVSQGEILSRITNDVDTLSQSLNQSVTQLITSVIHGWRADHDAEYQLAADIGSLVYSSSVFAARHGSREKIPGIFPGSAKVPWRGQRACGRNVRWSPGGQGF